MEVFILHRSLDGQLQQVPLPWISPLICRRIIYPAMITIGMIKIADIISPLGLSLFLQKIELTSFKTCTIRIIWLKSSLVKCEYFQELKFGNILFSLTYKGKSPYHNGYEGRNESLPLNEDETATYKRKIHPD